MKRVFIVGCPRSGTTLVQSLLAAHSRVTSFTESHFFDNKCFMPVGGNRYFTRSCIGSRVLTFLEENGFELANLNPIYLSGISGPKVARKTALALIHLLDQCAASRRARVWIEKTPNHFFAVPLLKQVAPDAQFIHVIRRPEGVIPSLYQVSRQWSRKKSWTECAFHWLWAFLTGEDRAGEEAHYLLSYERLVENPGPQIRRVIGWLGLDWEDGILEKYSQAAVGLITEKEVWKTGVFEPIVNKNRTTLAELPWVVRQFIRLSNFDVRLSRALLIQDTQLAESALTNFRGEKCLVNR